MPNPVKSLHQQAVDYAIQRIGQLSAELAARDLIIMDLRTQLDALTQPNETTTSSQNQNQPAPTTHKPKRT